jgi:diadenosine tetraphosphate (Ap4A) HIT family hydrolase
MTRAGARWGCFLPDLTRLASGSSTTNLPALHIVRPGPNCKLRFSRIRGDGGMRAFELDSRLAADTLPVAPLGLCQLRLMNDKRWRWLILVPQRVEITEFHDMTPLDQTMLTFELGLVSKALKQATRADKINIGMLGNRVPMFHCHVIARMTGDANWPDPVWGHGTREPYPADEGEALARRLAREVLAA